MDYSEYFETKKRVSGEDFIVIKDGAPEALRNMIEAIHFDLFNGCLPNDWIYQVISEAFDELERDNIDDITIETDCYTSDLLRWLADNGQVFAIDYCDQAMDDGELTSTDIVRTISVGQYKAKEAIYYAVNAWLQDQKEATDD